jgi:hypothetical protein
MALVLKDRVKETATAPGTGTITLGGAASGFQSFSVIGNTNTTYFAIVDGASGAWEVNYGTYTASGTTLSRNATPLSSSDGGALVNFTGAVDVFCTYPSSRSAYQNEAGTQVVQQSFGAITATSAALTTGTISTAPTSNTDIVNKQYADAIASGIHFHEAVALATTAALPANTYNNGTSGVGATLTANANGALSIDSTLTIAAERVLVKNEVAGANNGVYVVTQVGSAGTPYILTRATDFDSVGTGVDQIDEGDFFLVTSGVANLNTAWVQQTAPPITIGTTPIVFQQFSAPITYTAGTGLNESPTYTFNIANTTVSAATYGSASSVPVFAVNAQGQLTSVTNTAIAINGSAVTGAISGQAGSVANALTLGTYLTGTSYNGSAAVTATVDATSANTASKVVARDSSGDFSAGTITATLSGAATSATTATNLAGGAANQIPYQTAAGTTSFATAASGTNTVLNFTGSGFSWVNGTISGVALGSNLNALTLGTYLTGTSYNGSSTVTAAVDATSANTASKVVARDASGDFSAGTITAALSGNATTATSATTAGTITSQANSATITAASTNTANQIVLRDASGNFSAGTITAALSGNASTATTATTATNAGNATTAGGFTPSAVSGTANRIVVADASGYIKNTYFFSTDDVVGSGVTAVMVKQGDNYFRSGTAAAIATFISGQTINISGSATTFTSTSQNSQFNSIGVGTAGSGTAGEIRATNNVTAYYSDDRLKTRLGSIEGALDKVKTLDTFYYEANETAQALGYEAIREVGISAQQVQAVMPETVAPAPIDDKYLTVRYERLVPLLLAAIKELEAKVAALEAKG